MGVVRSGDMRLPHFGQFIGSGESSSSMSFATRFQIIGCTLSAFCAGGRVSRKSIGWRILSHAAARLEEFDGVSFNSTVEQRRRAAVVEPSPDDERLRIVTLHETAYSTVAGGSATAVASLDRRDAAQPDETDSGRVRDRRTLRCGPRRRSVDPSSQREKRTEKAGDYWRLNRQRALPGYATSSVAPSSDTRYVLRRGGFTQIASIG